MKSHKSIACIDFVNVNVALNSHAYKKKLEFYTMARRKIHCCSFKSFKPSHLRSYHDHTRFLSTT